MSTLARLKSFFRPSLQTSFGPLVLVQPAPAPFATRTERPVRVWSSAPAGTFLTIQWPYGATEVFSSAKEEYSSLADQGNIFKSLAVATGEGSADEGWLFRPATPEETETANLVYQEFQQFERELLDWVLETSPGPRYPFTWGTRMAYHTDGVWVLANIEDESGAGPSRDLLFMWSQLPEELVPHLKRVLNQMPHPLWYSVPVVK